MSSTERRDGQERRETEDEPAIGKAGMSNLIALGMPIFALALGSLTTWIWKVDDRQYQLSAELPSKYASKEDLKSLMKDFGNTVNFRFDMIEKSTRDERQQRDSSERDQRQDRENFQKQVLEEVKETNKNVQELALKLAKITSTTSKGE